MIYENIKKQGNSIATYRMWGNPNYDRWRCDNIRVQYMYSDTIILRKEKLDDVLKENEPFSGSFLFAIFSISIMEKITKIEGGM